jgi:hypothetical protein
MEDFSKLTVIIYDDLHGPAVDIRDNLRDFTEFKLQGRYQFHLVHTQHITQSLRQAIADGFEWAVVVAVGTWLRNSQTEVLDTLAHARTENVPLACHILDHGGYFHFHPQWFALDLQVYQQVGLPPLEESPEPVTVVTRHTERCADNAHDDYTPWWVRPGEDRTVEYASDRRYFGIDLISELIKAGYAITNIPEKVRQAKSYCYPNHQHESLKQMIADPAFIPERNQHTEALWWFDQILKNTSKNLYKGYYVINTEGITHSHEMDGRKFDRFIGVCGGQKPAVLVGSDNFAEGTQVVLYDISPAALSFQVHLLKTWDGDFDKFESVFRAFESQHPDYMPMYFQDKSIEQNVAWFYQTYGIDHDEFYRRWQKYRRCEFEFMQLDLHSPEAGHRIGSMVTASEHSTYLWTSNSFYMDYQMFYQSRAGMEGLLENFIDGVGTSANAEIVLENCNHIRVL